MSDGGEGSSSTAPRPVQPEDPDLYQFEGLLDETDLVPLQEALHKMDGVKFRRHGSGPETVFKYELVVDNMEACLRWARGEERHMQIRVSG